MESLLGSAAASDRSPPGQHRVCTTRDTTYFKPLYSPLRDLCVSVVNSPFEALLFSKPLYLPLRGLCVSVSLWCIPSPGPSGFI
jgi:hypothetical protein